ncbi:envelope protein UL78 [Human betaherpesvirus 5]|uniref:Envelope protein UL78 n=1 Tax=Human cytomegalovirus TaxID=10359 RepID=A0A0G2U6D5_HCMV|nr:envelope protein UL78 [Human betaherpesvirus 5]AMJ53104.1 envelope protein UL78 [Human betaherpesvirus 5]
MSPSAKETTLVTESIMLAIVDFKHMGPFEGYSMSADRTASDLLIGMFGSVSLVNLLTIIGCLWVLRVTRPPVSVMIFTWNLVLSQFFSIVATMLSKGIMLRGALNLSLCRLVLFVDDVGLYSTALFFLFLILDRLSAISYGRDLWHHETRENAGVALYAVAFAWVLSIVAAVPTAATGSLDYRWLGCQIPIQYAAVDLTIKMWFLLGAPMIAVLANVVELAYSDRRDHVWSYVGRVCTFYVTCLMLFVPYYCFRVLRGALQPASAAGTGFGIMDYVELATRTLLTMRLGILPLFIIAFFSREPTKDLDDSFDYLVERCQQSCHGHFVRRLVQALKRAMYSVELAVCYFSTSVRDVAEAVKKSSSRCYADATSATVVVTTTTSEKATLVEHAEGMASEMCPGTTIDVSAESSSVLCTDGENTVATDATVTAL